MNDSIFETLGEKEMHKFLLEECSWHTRTEGKNLPSKTNINRFIMALERYKRFVNKI
jgi:hypothetical protein